jgi:hypothetical protein
MKRATRNLVLTLLCATAVSSLGAPDASAQAATEEQKSEAKKLANEGARHFSEGNFARAYELFMQAEGHAHAPTFLLRAARAQERMDALIEARALYEKVAREKLDPGASKPWKQAQEDAKRALEAIDPRIPTVLIVLTPASSSARVRIDGAEVSPGRLGQPVQVNPGKHQIVAAVPGAGERSVQVTLKEGARERVELKFPNNTSPPIDELPPQPGSPPAATPPGASPPPVSAPAQGPYASSVAPLPAPNGAPSTSAGTPVPAIVAFSIGGAGLLTGVVAGAIWLSKNSDILPQCTDGECPARLGPEIDTTITIGRLAAAGFVIGAVGGVVGSWILFTSGGQAGSPGGAAKVVIGPGSIAVRGAF